MTLGRKVITSLLVLSISLILACVGYQVYRDYCFHIALNHCLVEHGASPKQAQGVIKNLIDENWW